jgi:hypothetical protein
MKQFLSILLTVASTILVLGQPRQTGINTDAIKNKWRDIPYASLSSAQKLDIYVQSILFSNALYLRKVYAFLDLYVKK